MFYSSELHDTHFTCPVECGLSLSLDFHLQDEIHPILHLYRSMSTFKKKKLCHF